MMRRLKVRLAADPTKSSIVDEEPGQDMIDMIESVTIMQDAKSGFLVLRIPLYLVDLQASTTD